MCLLIKNFIAGIITQILNKESTSEIEMLARVDWNDDMKQSC